MARRYSYYKEMIEDPDISYSQRRFLEELYEDELKEEKAKKIKAHSHPILAIIIPIIIGILLASLVRCGVNMITPDPDPLPTMNQTTQSSKKL